MAGAAKVNINTTNLTQFVTEPSTGIVFLQGTSIRGPYSSPTEVFHSWNRYVEVYGGIREGDDTAKVVKRLLDKGVSVRFSRVGNYELDNGEKVLQARYATAQNSAIIIIEGTFTNSLKVEWGIDGETQEITSDGDFENTINLIANKIEELEGIKTEQLIDGDKAKLHITGALGRGIQNITNLVFTGTGNALVTSTVILTDAVVTSNLEPAFSIKPKHPGEDYNNIVYQITPASNGSLDYFNLTIKHLKESNLTEEYVNLPSPIMGPIEAQTFLNKVIQGSKLVNVQYGDLSNESQNLNIKVQEAQLVSGDDGGTPTAEDYIGDSDTGNGFHAFNPYEDTYYLASIHPLDISSYLIDVAGASYASNRGDLLYVVEVPYDRKTKSSIIDYKESLNLNTKYALVIAGGIKVINPINGEVEDTRALPEVLEVAIKSDTNYGPWYSFAGPNRGNIRGALGVVTNFGSPANHKDLDELIDKKINMVIQRNGKTMLWGNYTTQLEDNQEKFINITKLIIYIVKSLKPSLEEFLEEPNDIPTWKRIYYTHLPFMDNLITSRALYSYEWQGDQFVNDMSKLKVNNTNDVSNGKYKILLPISAIPSLQEITLGIILTKAGVTFETIKEQI